MLYRRLAVRVDRGRAVRNLSRNSKGEILCHRWGLGASARKPAPKDADDLPGLGVEKNRREGIALEARKDGFVALPSTAKRRRRALPAYITFCPGSNAR